jgi:uncharacterized OB-fold protein
VSPVKELGLPSTERTSAITLIEKNKNPIFIALEDGTKLYLSYDEYKRLRTEPKIGMKMHVVFRRIPNDVSLVTSKIDNIDVLPWK